MEAKPFYQSKSLWFNLITIILAVLALPEFVSILPPAWLVYLGFINAIGNMIIRTFFTNGPVTGTQQQANIENRNK